MLQDQGHLVQAAQISPNKKCVSLLAAPEYTWMFCLLWTHGTSRTRAKAAFMTLRPARQDMTICSGCVISSEQSFLLRIRAECALEIGDVTFL